MDLNVIFTFSMDDETTPDITRRANDRILHDRQQWRSWYEHTPINSWIGDSCLVNKGWRKIQVISFIGKTSKWQKKTRPYWLYRLFGRIRIKYNEWKHSLQSTKRSSYTVTYEVRPDRAVPHSGWFVMKSSLVILSNSSSIQTNWFLYKSIIG